MTHTPDTLDLTAQAYTLPNLLAAAVKNKLRLTISTVEGDSTTGTPVQISGPNGGPALVTLTDGGDVSFVVLTQITKIVPNPEYVPVTVYTS